MNPLLDRLQPYPFEKLRKLFADLTPAPDKSAISLSIGEPRHPSPPFVLAALAANLDRLANYPFPGNVRELENILERAVALETSSSIRASSLPSDMVHGGRREWTPSGRGQDLLHLPEEGVDLEDLVEDIEKKLKM